MIQKRSKIEKNRKARVVCAAVMPARLTYYFDVVSPYTAFAWFVLQRYKSRWNLPIELKPIFLGGVMKATGNTPPAMRLPQLGQFMMGDLQRNRGYFSVPTLPTPSNFFSQVARKVIKVQRILVAAQQAGVSRARVEAMITRFTQAIHLDRKVRDAENNLNITDEFLVSTMVAAGASASEAKALLAAASTKPVKAALIANTNEAVERGAFGSPSFYVEGAPAPYDAPFLVFGSDRFEQMAFVLGKKWIGPDPDRAGTMQSKL